VVIVALAGSSSRITNQTRARHPPPRRSTETILIFPTFYPRQFIDLRMEAADADWSRSVSRRDVQRGCGSMCRLQVLGGDHMAAPLLRRGDANVSGASFLRSARISRCEILNTCEISRPSSKRTASRAGECMRGDRRTPRMKRDGQKEAMVPYAARRCTKEVARVHPAEEPRVSSLSTAGLPHGLAFTRTHLRPPKTNHCRA
jgi:hypothetical protein